MARVCKLGGTYIIPVGSAHFESTTSALADVLEIAVTDDVVEGIAAGPDPVTSSSVAL